MSEIHRNRVVDSKEIIEGKQVRNDSLSTKNVQLLFVCVRDFLIRTTKKKEGKSKKL